MRTGLNAVVTPVLEVPGAETASAGKVVVSDPGAGLLPDTIAVPGRLCWGGRGFHWYHNYNSGWARSTTTGAKLGGGREDGSNAA